MKKVLIGAAVLAGAFLLFNKSNAAPEFTILQADVPNQLIVFKWGNGTFTYSRAEGPTQYTSGNRVLSAYEIGGNNIVFDLLQNGQLIKNYAVVQL